MSALKYYLALACVVAPIGQAHAALIHYNGPGFASASHAGIETRHFPGDVSLTLDNSTGVLDIHRLDVLNDTKTAVGYSLPPLTLQLEPRATGWWLEFDLEGVPWRSAFLFHNMGTPDRDGPGYLFTFLGRNRTMGVPFEAPMIASSTEITEFEFQGVIVRAPEPSAWLLLGVALPLFARRAKWIS